MPLPVITIAQMREWENATWATGRTEDAVMRQAGQAVANAARRLTQPGESILVLAGKGHNGDDARFAAEYLPDRKISFITVRDPVSSQSDVAAQLAARPALLIDGLFGIGLDRQLGADWIKLIQHINAADLPALAVDVPSGLNADTGGPCGDAIHAAHTITLGTIKQGLLAATAWPFVGRLEAAPDIGLTPCPFQTELNWTQPSDFTTFPPRRSVASHKGTHGHVVIIAGSQGYHGAAVLAARGAQRAQPGLITLYTQDLAYPPVAAQLQSVMVQPWILDAGFTPPPTCTALVLGPGLAAPKLPESIIATAQRLWLDSPLPVIADAAALAWLPERSYRLDAIRCITPHPGEAAQLLRIPTDEVQANRSAAVRELSQRYGGCWVVLKGHQTIVGRATGEVFVNSSGNPHLAQGGSGDVLAGYLGGLLAQAALQSETGRTIRYGVWQHGAAADGLCQQRRNWTVEDLLDVLGNTSALNNR
ncbi:MAG TPA: NAD(P)H-hydrate dehydratase [Verrucomicrobiae bacterium]